MSWDVLPGETPTDDLSGLKVPGICTRAELNAAEAENIAKAAIKYLAARPSKRSARFDFTWALKLHWEMFGDVWDLAGEVRKIDLNIGVPFFTVPQELYGLLEDLPRWSDYGQELVEQAVRLHHRAAHIHPFKNGNGRWARMLANIWLKQNRSGIIHWPEETIGAQSIIRDDYIAAIRAADNGDFQALLQLHRQFQVE